MDISAGISRQWTIRMLIVGVVFVGFGLWAIYDGTIHYPRRNRAIRAYQELKEENRSGEWPELASEKGWAEEPPDEDDYKTQTDIMIQFIMAALCLPFGLAVLIRLWIKSKQSLGVDEKHFYPAEGGSVPLSEITGIDKSRWNSKAIAMVLYNDAQGKERKKSIDAWIFAGGEDILRRIEEITGFQDEVEERTEPDQEEK